MSLYQRVRDRNSGVVVKTIKGDRKAAGYIARMTAKGYELQNQSSRKVWWNPLTGVFTRQQKHTLTFTKLNV